jgi:integrase
MTGMLQHEMWGRWEVRRDHVHISGTKRKGRDRDVPLVWRPAVPQLHRRTFENKVRERCPDMEARDLRNTYATWMEDAAIPRTRRRMYLGHGTRDVTDLYERREITIFLVEDAERMRLFLGLSHDKSHDLRAVK